MEATDLFSRRKKRRVLQSELAKLLGVNHHALQLIEHGTIGIDMETYQRVVRAIDEIAERKVQEPPKPETRGRRKKPVE